MPFKSDKQRRYFYYKAKTSPKWAKMVEEWESETKGQLPEKINKKKAKARIKKSVGGREPKRYTYYKRYKRYGV